MPVGRTLYGGSPYLGVYLKAGDQTALAPNGVPRGLAHDVERLLGVRVIRTQVMDTEVVGSFVAMNSHGLVVGDDLSDEELHALAGLGRVAVVRHRQNAMGNNVLANDHGALVHPELSADAVEKIGRALEVPAVKGTLAGLGTVGMAGIATNKGVVVHPKTTEGEAEVVRSLLGVPVHRSTANFGVPIVGACLVANSRGMIVGRPTTPVEIVHLQEGLQIFD
ncbi:MAG: translation initiation factor IF-6 [Thermoplasmata archaeon]|nr:translation initiation factor IF-6 [Thermoplasmata archaeon]